MKQNTPEKLYLMNSQTVLLPPQSLTHEAPVPDSRRVVGYGQENCPAVKTIPPNKCRSQLVKDRDTEIVSNAGSIHVDRGPKIYIQRGS